MSKHGGQDYESRTRQFRNVMAREAKEARRVQRGVKAGEGPASRRLSGGAHEQRPLPGHAADRGNAGGVLKYTVEPELPEPGDGGPEEGSKSS